MSEPIDNGSELVEAEKGDRESIVARIGTAEARDAAEEVFCPLPLSVVTEGKRYRPTTGALCRNADVRALSAKPGAKRVGVKSFVCAGAAFIF